MSQNEGEFMPIDAYALLRRASASGPQRLSPSSIDDETAARFLISRGLAERDEATGRLAATAEGKAFGRITRKGST